MVALTNNTIITNYTFTSESGFDYGVPLQPASNSTPAVVFELMAPDYMAVRWPTEPLQIYQVDTSTNLSEGGWLPAADLLVGDGSEFSIEDFITDQQRFYRVLSIPNPRNPIGESELVGTIRR